MRATWTNENPVAAGWLTFNWPYDGQNEFSFGVGGTLVGEPFDDHAFVAEVKNYEYVRSPGASVDSSSEPRHGCIRSRR